MSNIVYVSLGKGGGTRTEGIGEKNGQQNLQEAYNANVGAGPFGPIIDTEFSNTEYNCIILNQNQTLNQNVE